MRFEADVYEKCDKKPDRGGWTPANSPAPDRLIAASVFDHERELLGRVFHEDTVASSRWRFTKDGEATLPRELR